MIVVFLVVLVVFGPQKLPELARSLGKLMAEFRKASTDFRSAFEEEMRDLERQARLAELRKQAAEAVTAATIAETTAQNAQNAKKLPDAIAAPKTGVEALPEPFSAERSLTQGPVITPVADTVARTEEGSKEARSNQIGSNEAGSNEDANSKSAASDGANGESVTATESTPSHDQQPA